ncbi:SCP2 sterol-binding domain-containing protein [Aquisalimonas sp.]|uniref:ubiquinone anaerobic biosynthesis accessory factor UbiT n=1 Tax=unclassified Aquisalimonas TaxID=2644645 RepID=UPI0025BA9138|nr:SCP2 sterol-binding domain-containing protein [Aquisalimonas sp.]
MRLVLPRPAHVLRPAQMLPASLLEAIVATVSTRVLRDRIADGALDPLGGRVIRIVVRDPDVSVRLTLRDGRIVPAPPGQDAAATVTAFAEDLVQVMAQRVDPDTLFFHRRLGVQGDTALGLAVKNVLDSVDPAELPTPVTELLRQAADHVPGATSRESG